MKMMLAWKVRNQITAANVCVPAERVDLGLKSVGVDVAGTVLKEDGKLAAATGTT